MSGHVLPFEGHAHRDVERLLPWYANATLDPDEDARVRAHLIECAACRAELATLRAVMELAPPTTTRAKPIAAGCACAIACTLHAARPVRASTGAACAPVGRARRRGCASRSQRSSPSSPCSRCSCSAIRNRRRKPSRRSPRRPHRTPRATPCSSGSTREPPMRSCGNCSARTARASSMGRTRRAPSRGRAAGPGRPGAQRPARIAGRGDGRTPRAAGVKRVRGLLLLLLAFCSGGAFATPQERRTNCS